MGSVNSARKKVLFPHPVVQTEYGFVEGKKVFSSDGNVINVFLGIPFAKPPVGNLRFEKPVKPDPWSTPRKCKKYRDMSIQFKLPMYGITKGRSEDCLYLNITAPDKPCHLKSGFPVMFYVHGGAFIMDSAINYPYQNLGRTLVRHDVIVVTTSYRLGLLGFFCTDDETAMGNYGIWDQVFALKFVYDNISKFGGDPENITVFGQSAGGVSTDLLSILPMTKHMVKKIGVLGGNCETIWGVYARSNMAKICQNSATRLGFERVKTGKFTKIENSAMLLYLKSLPSSAFALSTSIGKVILKEMRLPVGPIVDGDLIPAPPYVLREDAPRRPIIAGITLHEGLVFVPLRSSFTLKGLLPDLERSHTFMNKIITTVYGSEAGISLNELKKAYGITDLSIKDTKFIKKTIIQILDDSTNNYALYNYAQSERKRGSTVWMYIFEHHNPGIISHMSLMTPFNKASHGTELFYLMDVNIYVKNVIKNKNDKIVTDIFTKMYTNFAKYGNPNGDPRNPADLVLEKTIWEPVTEDYPEKHLRILPTPVQTDHFENRRCEKFGEFYSKYSRYICDPDIFKDGKYENGE